jgi:hypothetical protein
MDTFNQKNMNWLSRLFSSKESQEGALPEKGKMLGSTLAEQCALSLTSK